MIDGTKNRKNNSLVTILITVIACVIICVPIGIFLGKNILSKNSKNDNNNIVTNNLVTKENSNDELNVKKETITIEELNKIQKRYENIRPIFLFMKKNYNFTIENLNEDELLYLSLNEDLKVIERKSVEDKENLDDFIYDTEKENLYYKDGTLTGEQCVVKYDASNVEKNYENISFGKKITNRSFKVNTFAGQYIYSEKYNAYYNAPCGGGMTSSFVDYLYKYELINDNVYLYVSYNENSEDITKDNCNNYNKLKISFKMYNNDYYFYSIEKLNN